MIRFKKLKESTLYFMKDFLIKSRIKILEVYKQQKQRKEEDKKIEDKIFAEELAKVKIETRKTKDDEIRTKAAKAAKMTNKGVPASISKGIVGGISELKKGQDSIKKIQDDLAGLNSGKKRESLLIDYSKKKKEGGDYHGLWTKKKY